MNRLVLAGFILLMTIGCSDKQEEIKPTKELNVTKVENNETKNKIKTEIKMDTNITKKNMMVIKEEFIPEHIRRSHIEVVEHY